MSRLDLLPEELTRHFRDGLLGPAHIWLVLPRTSDSCGWDGGAEGVNAWLPKNAVIVNKKAFDALDKPTQDALLKAAADAEARGLAASKKANSETLDKLKANGMQILPPGPQLKADLKKVGDTMITDWAKQAGPDGQAVLGAYRK